MATSANGVSMVKASFTKEALMDMNAAQFIDILDHMLTAKAENAKLANAKMFTAQYMNEPPPVKPPLPKKLSKEEKKMIFASLYGSKPKWEELLLPGIRQHWHELTGGNAETCTYHHDTETYNIVFSQGMCAKLPRELFQDQQYVYIQEIIKALAQILEKYNGSIGGFDYKTETGVIYSIGISWQIKGEQKAKELHVYDLGDGMLVPCQLADEIAQWSKLGKLKHEWYMSKEMIEDDMYGAIPDAVAVIAKKVDADILKSLEAYPGKVFFLDDPAGVEIVGAHADLIIADDLYKDDGFLEFLTKVNSHVNGPVAKPYKSMAEFIGGATVTIPKKPAQITKESLEHFHKLLGGKKNPF